MLSFLFTYGIDMTHFSFRSVAFVKFVYLVVVLFAFAGCATNLSQNTSTLMPTKVKFGQYDQVFVTEVSISDEFAKHGANQKARIKINEILQANLNLVFPNMKTVDSADVTGQSGLIIVPHIKDIKFISGGARFWAGALAGSSAVLMETTFKDARTGEVVAKPEFYRSANAYAGALTFGTTDNRMLEDVAKDVVNYASLNK